MTEPLTRGHRADLVYTETDLGETTAAFTQYVSPDGMSIVVEGSCPRCSGRTVSEFPYGVPTAGSKSPWLRRRSRRAEPDLVGTEVHYCECRHPHPGLPAEAPFVGCGASWRVCADPAAPIAP
ncbi:hypothetical protein [Streptomyces melanogenes]|uniref:hypothetical protein n=1 Tax=Streptomyces melanogenes TaxID=67326 RepID=UPI0037BA9578